MSKAFRVVVADDEPDLLEFYTALLRSLGHDVLSTVTDGESLVAQCRELRPDLVISDIKMPRKNGVDAVSEVFRREPLRVILVTGHHAPEHIHQVLEEMVLAYLAKPFQRRDLAKAIARADLRFQEFEALLACCHHHRDAVAHRELLRLAKGVLMKSAGIGDHDAFCRLKKDAADRGLSLIEWARTVLDGETHESGESIEWPANRHSAVALHCRADSP